MNMKKVLPLLFLGLLCYSTASAQLSHFQHGEELIYKFPSHPNNFTSRGVFDTVIQYKYQNTGKMVAQVHGASERPKALCLFNSQGAQQLNTPNGFLFDIDDDSLNVFHNYHKILGMPKSIQVGDTAFTDSVNGIILDRIDIINVGAISDSALIFYSLEKGVQTNDSFVLGKNIGWVYISYIVPFQLLDQVKAGQFQNILIPDWQDFYPEEPGDVKLWHAVVPGVNQLFFLDSFVSVSRYIDSIVWQVDRYHLDSSYIWHGPNTYNRTIIHSGSDLEKSLSFNHYLEGIVPDTNGFYMQANFRTIDPGFISYDVIRDSLTDDPNNSCKYISAIYNFAGYALNTYYGEGINYAGRANYVLDETLVAAKVGSHIFGTFININLSNKSLRKPSLSLYPNPANTEVNIAGLDEEASYQLYAYDGKLIESGNVSGGRINTRHIKTGVYFLLVQDCTTMYRNKLVIKH